MINLGDDTGIIKSYNYDGGVHLADQQQKICFRREDGKTKLCFYTSAYNDFQLSKGKGAGGTVGSFLVTDCCSYGDDGKKEEFDCVMIPSVSTTKGGLLKETGEVYQF